MLVPGRFTSVADGLAPLSGGGTSNFLRADGTWAAAGSGSFTNPQLYVNARFYWPFVCRAAAGINISATVTRWLPVWLGAGMTVTALGIRVGTAGSTNFYMALYASGSDGLPTGANLTNTGAVVNTSANTFTSATVSYNVTAAGVYWIGYQCADATQTQMGFSDDISTPGYLSGVLTASNLASGGAAAQAKFSTTSTTPGTWPSGPTIVETVNSNVYYLPFYKVSVP